jgi:hypothetical protein
VNKKLEGNFFDWRQEVTAFFAPSAQRNKQLIAARAAGEADTAMGLLHSATCSQHTTSHKNNKLWRSRIW